MARNKAEKTGTETEKKEGCTRNVMTKVAEGPLEAVKHKQE